MSDGLAHGVNIIGTFTPIQLWAGEPNGQSTQGVAASGNTFGQVNARGETFKFPVVALVGGYLVPWNPLADSNNPNAWASGTITISSTGPLADETVTVNGDVFTFKAVADADYEVALGATVTETATNLKNAINDMREAIGLGVIATSAAGVVTVKAPGDAGNAVTLAETGTNVAISGATLSGGTDSDAEIGGARKPYGVLPHALDTTVTGYNAAVDTPVFISGHFNFDALDLPDGTAYEEIKAAFAGTPINIQRLY